MHPNVAVVFDEAKLAKPIHERADAGPCGADHLRESFQRDPGNQCFRLAMDGEGVVLNADVNIFFVDARDFDLQNNVVLVFVDVHRRCEGGGCQRLFRLLPNTGFESAGFDRCAISLFASRPGREIMNFSASAGLYMWESRKRFPSLASARRHLQTRQAQAIPRIHFS